MLIFKNETFDINPKNVPTGHIELQYNLPFKTAVIETANIINAVIIIIMRSAYLISTECMEYILNFNNIDAIILLINNKPGVAIDDKNLPYNENGSSHRINRVPIKVNDINVKHSIKYLKILFSFE
jgi:hypothetical protein